MVLFGTPTTLFCPKQCVPAIARATSFPPIIPDAFFVNSGKHPASLKMTP